MNYWWVNHKQTYKAEVGGGYIWSPTKNKNNSVNKSYINLTETNIGDVVFSYADTSQMLGHNSLKTTQHYAKVIDTKVSTEMFALQEKLLDRDKKEEDTGDTKVMKLFR